MAEEKKADIDSAIVHQAVALLDELNLTELEYGADGWHVRVSRHRGPPAPATAAGDQGEAAPSPSQPDDYAGHPGVVTAPMVGIVYTAAEPNAPPMVRVGDQVTEGQPVLLIEAMKVFNRIEAHRSGKVTRIMVSSGTPVEFGEPLLIIE